MHSGLLVTWWCKNVGILGQTSMTIGMSLEVSMDLYVGVRLFCPNFPIRFPVLKSNDRSSQYAFFSHVMIDIPPGYSRFLHEPEFFGRVIYLHFLHVTSHRLIIVQIAVYQFPVLMALPLELCGMITSNTIDISSKGRTEGTKESFSFDCDELMVGIR
jgi:hypothetical protein